MAGYTDYLNLYYKNPSTDGADTFNVQTMMNDNWEKIDEFASMAGLAPAGNGFAFIRCKDADGNPVSGCVCQIGSNVAITNTMGMSKFTLPGGVYTGTVTSPIDYGAGIQTVPVSVANSKEKIVDVQINDTTGELNEIGITTSAMLMFSSRVVNADAFLVGGGGSGGAAYAIIQYALNNIETSGSGGAGGKTTTLLGINHYSLIDISIGAGGESAIINEKRTNLEVGTINSINGNKGGTTTIKINGTIVGTAEGGDGGLGYASRNATKEYHLGVSGAPGGSGSGGVLTAGGYKTPLVGDSGFDGSSGGDVTGDSVTASGGPGQETTTVPFNGDSAESARSPAGGSVGVSGVVIYGSVGNGGGAASGTHKDVSNSAGIDVSASPGSVHGAGGGACCATMKGIENSDYTYILKSGAGASGEVRFRWEVES